ncbi:MAG TPA: hypothetical protein VN819_04330 [Thermoplasmata archaeon]|nr:hypothetical protein [Thermoplasmata archaeon]HXQ79426.1 hypothetical protein [Thermoplasmata archaeon]
MSTSEAGQVAPQSVGSQFDAPPGAEAVDCWIASGRRWVAFRFLLVMLPPLLILAVASDWAGVVRYGGSYPLWLFLGLFPIAVVIALFFAWTASWQVPARIQLGPEGLTFEYQMLRPIAITGPWGAWTPKNALKLFGTVYFEFQHTIPYLGVTIPQAQAILRSRWAPAWELPLEVRRAVGIGKPATREPPRA